jgi:hypothetical protein
LSKQDVLCLESRLTSNDSVYRSRIFTFLVGENKTPIAVHAEVIATQSKALNALINGKMEEAQSGCAFLSDVTEDDFLRFCQYAYTGDYATPPFTMIEAEKDEIPIAEAILDQWPPPAPPLPVDIEPAPNEILVEEDLNADFVWTPLKKKIKGVKQKKSHLYDAFFGLSSPTEYARQPLLDSYKVVENTSPREDFTPVFLAHARLYVFADKYGIESLKLLVLGKIQQTLVGFKCFGTRLDDVVESVRFSYCNDNTPDEGDDQLRALVLQFVTCKQDKIGESESFLALLEEGGPLVRDFWLSIRKGLLT